MMEIIYFAVYKFFVCLIGYMYQNFGFWLFRISLV